MSQAWSILLIDDEEDIREVMAVTLTDAGHTVRTAADGAAGIRLCSEAPPQIVITDIRMPGMDGLQVLERLKAQHPDIEVIVATAFGEMDLAIRALQLDASDFITKPISSENLFLALQRAGERFTSRRRLKDYTLLLEKEKAETSQQLLKTIAFQRNLIESSMDGILGCDDEGRVLIYNGSMERLAGYGRSEALAGMRFDQFFAAAEAASFRTQLAGEGFGGAGRLYLYETILKAGDGRVIPVQVSAATLMDEGRPVGVVGFFRDLRELRKLERDIADQARILHQDKMISLGRLAASVVHEINNPLAGILNYIRLMARLLQQGPLTGERQQKFERYVGIIESETGRCAQIVSGLLSFSRRSPAAFGPVDVAELIERCVLLSRHKLELGQIRLDTRGVQTGLPALAGDFNQLQQCLINLIFNAVDAMPNGGTLTMEARLEEPPAAVLILVRDTGPGIPPEHLANIFEPFFTTKSEGHGLGLGLSTVFGIVARHHGTIAAQNHPEGGALFVITLPLAAAHGGWP
ncbi:MAG: response regulator [Desulfobacterales bacterium]|nr:response regulator [Desulfobacterales bacterium]